jgi:hypothetical protein
MKISGVYKIALISIVALIVLGYLNLITVSIFPAWLALVLSLIGVYYSNESLVMNVKMRHSEDLHKFIGEWKIIHDGFYHKVIPNFATSYSRGELDINRRIYGLDLINNDTLHNDLISNHLGKYYELKSDWNRYIKDVNDFEMKLGELRKQVEELFFEELKKNKLNPTISYAYEGTETLTPNIADLLMLIYSGAISEKHQLQIQESNYSMPKTNSTLKGFNVLATRNNGTYQATVAIAKEERTAKIYLKVFNELQDENNIKLGKIKTSIKEIKSKDAEIDKLFAKVSKYLTDLDRYPVFGEKCDFVQRAL